MFQKKTLWGTTCSQTWFRSDESLRFAILAWLNIHIQIIWKVKLNHDDDDYSRIIYTFVLGQSVQCILISITSLGTQFCLETKFSLKESIYSNQKLRQIGYGVCVFVLIIFRTPGGVYKKISDCCHDIHTRVHI